MFSLAVSVLHVQIREQAVGKQHSTYICVSMTSERKNKSQNLFVQHWNLFSSHACKLSNENWSSFPANFTSM